MSEAIEIRAATPADVDLIFSLIVALAEYEQAADPVTGSEELLAAALFGPQPCAQALIAQRALGAARAPRTPGAPRRDRAGGADPAGFALFYATFSTWECRPGIWLEDLYVLPEHRRAGVGEALLSHVGRIALQRGCARLEWAALHWNAPALRFYEKLGAERLQDWGLHRLEGAALGRVADRALARR